jgi:predicted lipid-binding transport protein (Tim44 family)
LQLLDIILLAMIAVFIALRLGGVLGRRTGHEQRPEQRAEKQTRSFPRKSERAGDKIVTLPERGNSGAGDDLVAEASARAGLNRIKAADRTFDLARFIAGAKLAYEAIVNAFAKGDLAALKPLLSPEVFSSFESEITGRQHRGEKQETTLVGFKSAKVVEADLKGRMAEITVRFISELIHATRNAEGNIIAGTPNAVDQVTENWTFARDVRSSDPNWALIDTSVPA